MRQFSLSLYPESLLQPWESHLSFILSHFPSHETHHLIWITCLGTRLALSIYSDSLLQPRDSLSASTQSHFSSRQTGSRHLHWVTSTMRLALILYPESFLQAWDSPLILNHFSSHKTQSQRLPRITSPSVRLALSTYTESLQQWDSLLSFTLSHFSSHIKRVALRSQGNDAFSSLSGDIPITSKGTISNVFPMYECSCL